MRFVSFKYRFPRIQRYLQRTVEEIFILILFLTPGFVVVHCSVTLPQKIKVCIRHCTYQIRTKQTPKWFSLSGGKTGRVRRTQRNGKTFPVRAFFVFFFCPPKKLKSINGELARRRRVVNNDPPWSGYRDVGIPGPPTTTTTTTSGHSGMAKL